MKHITKNKKGAASFYVVAFSTLILLIIAASFTALIIAQITRTSNDDLSQSAYDSALAGVEDGKLAYYAYQDCLANMEGEGCNDIISIMESSQEDGQGGVNECDGVSKVLRGGDYSGEVIIKESEGAENNMQQAYTCVKVITTPKDYEGSLSSTNPMKVVRLKFDGVTADSINRVKVSWAETKKEDGKWNNFRIDGSNGFVQFPSGNDIEVADPPTIAVALLQAGDSFAVGNLLSKTNEGQTDRGMVYLVPVEKGSVSLSNNDDNNYKIANDNEVPADAMLNSNAQMAQNKPYVVECGDEEGSGLLCSAMVYLPKPIGGTRSDENFIIAVMLPYGSPSTVFSLEFYKDQSLLLGEQTDMGPVGLKDVQIAIDSTGRANDIYRRVEVRLEGKDNNNLSIMGPLELSGDDGNGGGTGAALKKESTVCEWTELFGGPTC